MTLRQRLGPDVQRVHEQLDELLDSEDGIILLVDRQRAINYALGFALSACQLELLADDIERTVRDAARANVPDNRGNQPRERQDCGAGSRLKPITGGRERRNRASHWNSNSKSGSRPRGDPAARRTG